LPVVSWKQSWHIKEMENNTLTLDAYVRSLIRDRERHYASPFVVSAVGGGGKTSTLIHLFDTSIRSRSILTTTTALGVPGAAAGVAPPLSKKQQMNPGLTRISLTPPPDSGVWLGTAFAGNPDKRRGIDRNELDGWVREQREKAVGDTIVLCEADGSKRKPLKAHAAHEPVIPKTTDLTLILLGMSALGKPLDEDTVHRSRLFSQATGLEPGQPIGVSHLIDLLRSGLFFKGIPPTSKIAVVFNQVDCLEESKRTLAFYIELAEQILEFARVDAVFFKGLDQDEQKTCYGLSKRRASTAPFSAVLLAAGKSERMGEPNKLLLPLGNQPLIARTVSRVLSSDVRDLVVVLGFEEERVKEAIEGAIRELRPESSVTFVTNDRYQEGQGSSVAMGTRSLATDNLASFYVPGDQPFVSPLLMRQLMEEFEAGKMMIPLIGGKRSSPVLVSRVFYPDMASLTGDQGGRQLFQNHPEALVEIPFRDHLAAFDLDTPQDYQEALRLDARGAPKERS
jgi:molybdenum cofactor cytidylyltransferase